MTRRPGIPSACLVLLCLFQCAAARAQTTVEGVRDIYRADGTNATIEESRARVVPLPPAPSAPITVGNGRLWLESDPFWIGRTVALGDHGTQVFTEFDISTHSTQLVSGFDAAPVSPLFEYPQVPQTANVKVAAADDAGAYVSCRQVPVGGPNGPLNTSVSLYTSVGGLRWTYQFPGSSYGPARAMVSSDGTRIVAGMLDSTMNLQLRVFGPGSNVPVWQGSFLNGPQLRSLLMSADGSRLYWASATSLSVLNLATHQIEANFALFNALDCHAISANGGVFAYGGFNFVDVYERQAAGNYVRTYTWNVPGQAVCGRLDVSADGSTIVAGFNLWSDDLGVKIMALDVPTKTVTMSDTAVGAGTLQNIVASIKVSADGERFVAGLWGDEANLVDDLRFYRKHQNAPVATYDHPGSVYDVDISPDGKRVAAATKAVHANLYEGGGSIELYAFESEDLVMSGIPHVGSVVHFEMSGAANSPARLIFSPSAAAHPSALGSLGTLYLNRLTMSSVSMGTTGIHGMASRDYALPTLPTTIGTKLYFQGMTTTPRKLTESWVEVTILP